MNKKVDEEFEKINDVYVLQCTCTEMKEKIVKSIQYINKNMQFDGVKWLRKELLEILDKEVN